MIQSLPVLPASVEVYECDHCGLCCTELIVECDPFDAIREPLIAEKCKLLDGHGKMPIEEASFGVACGETQPCPFHVDHRCTIHPTRPNVCAAFMAGSEKCQELRRGAGLPELQPVFAPATVRNRILAAFHDEEDD